MTCDQGRGTGMIGPCLFGDNFFCVGGSVQLHDGLVMAMTGDFTSKMTGENS